MDVRECALK
jgi:hypothetical protein